MTDNQVLLESDIFKGLSVDDVEKLLKCASARRQTYPKDTFIMREGDKASVVCILLSGEVGVVFEDFWGNRALVDKMYPGRVFGDAYVYAADKTVGINVLAVTSCEVMLFDYEKLILPCASACACHREVVTNLLHSFADKLITMMRKMTFVSKRTLREKIMAYLSFKANVNRGAIVDIPMSRQELADYLYVDRSALSRELGALKKEGLIDFSKNSFKLIKKQ